MNIVCAASDLLGMYSIPYIHEHHPINLLITQPDRHQGRGRKLQSSPLVAFAEEAGIAVYRTEHLRKEAREAIAPYKPDVLVSIAFGRKFGPKFMQLFSWGGLNLHPSLLPKYRGSSPLQASILNGDTSFGVSVQEIVQEMDAGRIVLQDQAPLGSDETLEELIVASAAMGKKLLVAALDAIVDGSYTSYEQDETKLSYCGKISKEDGRIDWNDSALHIARMLRAYTPWPGCYSFVESLRIRIRKGRAYSEQKASYPVGSMRRIGNEIRVSCGKGELGITCLQFAGKKELSVSDLLNGAPEFCTKRFEVSMKA